MLRFVGLAVVFSAATAAGSDFNSAEIAKRALPAIVSIRSTIGSDVVSGSGFIVDPSGTIITNLHVVRGATAVAVKVSSGDVYDQVKIRSFDERKDLAVLQISGFGLPTVPLGNSDDLAAGQEVLLIGNPFGVLEGSVTRGIVSAVRALDEGYKVVQTDAAANHGNSGGPMLNERGEAVAVLTFKLGEGKAESLNFAIPINYARGLLASSDSLSLADLQGRLGKTTDLFSREGGLPARWKSLSSGTTKILRVDGDNLYVETVLNDEQKKLGSFNLAELKKAGDKYVGQGHRAFVCSYIGFTAFVGKHWKTNRCSDEWPIEITTLTPSRIEGRTPGYPPNSKFDCGKCSHDGAKTWQAFTWIPE